MIINLIIIVPILLLFLFVNILGTYAIYKDTKNGQKDTHSYYYGNFGVQNIYKKRSRVDFVINIVKSIVVLFSIFVLGFFVALNENFRMIWNGTGGYVDTLGTIMYKMWMTLIGLYFVFTTFSKRTWLVFDAGDIIKKFKIKETLLKMGVYILINNVIYFFKPIILANLIYELYFGIRLITLSLFLWFIYYFIKLCYLLIESYFGDGMNMFFLDLLYEELCFHPIREAKDNKWEDKAVRMSINYLNRKLIDVSKKISIEKIIFMSNMYYEDEKCEYKRKRNKIVKRRSLMQYILYFIFYIGALLSAASYSYVKNGGAAIIWGIVVVTLVTLVICIIFFGNKVESFASFLILLFYGRCCYEFKSKSCNKNGKFAKDYPIIYKSNYVKYVRVMKNIIAFYMISPDENKKIIIDEIKKNEKDNSEPSIIMGVLNFLSYFDGKNVEIFRELEIGDRNYLCDKIRAFCMDVAIRCKGITESDFNRKFEQFIKDKGH